MPTSDMVPKMIREGRTSERATPRAKEINGLEDFPKDKNGAHYQNILYLQDREPSHESEFSECCRPVTAVCLPIFLLQNMNVYPVPVLLGGQRGRPR